MTVVQGITAVHASNNRVDRGDRGDRVGGIGDRGGDRGGERGGERGGDRGGGAGDRPGDRLGIASERRRSSTSHYSTADTPHDSSSGNSLTLRSPMQSHIQGHSYEDSPLRLTGGLDIRHWLFIEQNGGDVLVCFDSSFQIYFVFLFCVSISCTKSASNLCVALSSRGSPVEATQFTLFHPAKTAN